MPSEMAMKTVVFRMPGMDEVSVRRGVTYLTTEAGALTMDAYSPVGDGLKPAVVIVMGYPDVGVPLVFGCQFREMGWVVSWARLLAASGMVGVVYETRNPAADADAVLACVRKNAAGLGIDATRLGVWACSGHVPVALSMLMDGNLQCGVLSYGFMLDLDGATAVANAAAQFRFANASAGRRVEDLPAQTPLLIVRAGLDQFAGLNDSIGRFVADALRCNLPVTVVNHPTGPHAFDILDDSEASRNVVRAMLAFLKTNLGA
jgi:hypothetical protein